MEKKSVKLNDSDNSAGTLSVGFGIISILFSILTPFFGVIFSFIGLGFYIAQTKKSKNSWSKAGFILFIIGLILNVIVWILAATLMFNSTTQLGI